MTHEHRSESEKCSCGCHTHGNKNNYIYMPGSLDYGPPCRITGAEINWTFVLVVWAIVAYVLYGCGFGALEGVLLAPVVMLVLVAVLIAVVGTVVWLIAAVAKLLRSSPKGIEQDEIGYDSLHQGKKQKNRTKWSEAGFALFLTTAMVLCLLIDQFYF